MAAIETAAQQPLVASFDLGIKHMAVCVTRYIVERKTWEIHEWELFALSGQCMRDHTFSLVEELSSRAYLNDVDVVLIESQPRFNTKTRTLSHCIQTYFATRNFVVQGTHTAGLPPRCYQRLLFVNAANKLTVYKGPPINIKASRPHKRNKLMAEAHTEALLEEHGLLSRLEWFRKLKNVDGKNKRDDAADALLQAWWFTLKEANESERYLNREPIEVGAASSVPLVGQNADSQNHTPIHIILPADGVDQETVVQSVRVISIGGPQQRPRLRRVVKL